MDKQTNTARSKVRRPSADLELHSRIDFAGGKAAARSAQCEGQNVRFQSPSHWELLSLAGSFISALPDPVHALIVAKRKLTTSISFTATQEMLE